MFRLFNRLWELFDDYVLYTVENVVAWVGARLGKVLGRCFDAVAANAVWVYATVLTPVGRAALWVFDLLVFRPLDTLDFWRHRSADGQAARRVGQTLDAGAEAALRPLEKLRSNETRFAVLLALACLVVLWLYWRHNVGDLRDPAAFEVAQTARNLADGGGLTTSAIRPLSFTFHEGVERHPDFAASPLQAVVTALTFVLGKSSDRAAALASAIFLLPTLWLLYRIAFQIGGLSVAVLAVLSYLLAPGVLREAFAGTATQLTALLLTLWVYVALFRQPAEEHDDEEEREDGPTGGQGGLDDEEEPLEPWSRWKLVGVGALFAALGLADWRFTLLWPVALAFSVDWAGQRRWLMPGVLFLAGWVVVLAPWFVRNSRLTGDPGFSLRSYAAVVDTARYPGTTLLRTVMPETHHAARLAVRHARWVARKVGRNLLALRDRFGNWFGGYFFAMLFLGLMVHSERVSAWGLKGPLVAFLLLASLLDCAFTGQSAGLLAFAPLAMALGANALLNHVAGWYQDDESRSVQRRSAAAHVGLPVLIVVLGGAPTVMRLFTGEAPEHPLRALASLSEEPFGRDAVFVSDAPWQVAWYSGCTAVWTPHTTQDLALLETQLTPIAGAVLTRQVASLGGETMRDAIRWTRLYTNPTFFAGYLPRQRLKDGTVIYRNVRSAAGKDTSGSAGPEE